ncbi:HAMP domain-containing protein [Archaeoglobus sp.]
MKITPKILAIVIIASLVPLGILAQLTYVGITQFGDQAKKGVFNVSQEYLAKAGEEAVRMKAQDLALQVQTYVQLKMQQNPNLTTRDLINDPEFLKIALQQWGAKEYTWVGVGGVVGGKPRAILLAHPVVPKQYWGLDVEYHLKWNKTLPELYSLLTKVTENPEAPQPVCGYYHWKEPGTEEIVLKYLCHYPTTIKIYDPVLQSKQWLVVGTSAYIDGYFQYLTQNPANPSENIASEIDKNIESASQQVYYNLGIAAAVAIVFVAILAIFTTSRIAGPITEISRTADKISEGDLEAEVPFQDRDDEIGILARSIERLRRSLKVAMESLEEALK